MRQDMHPPKPPVKHYSPVRVRQVPGVGAEGRISSLGGRVWGHCMEWQVATAGPPRSQPTRPTPWRSSTDPDRGEGGKAPPPLDDVRERRRGGRGVGVRHLRRRRGEGQPSPSLFDGPADAHAAGVLMDTARFKSNQIYRCRCTPPPRPPPLRREATASGGGGALPSFGAPEDATEICLSTSPGELALHPLEGYFSRSPSPLRDYYATVDQTLGRAHQERGEGG